MKIKIIPKNLALSRVKAKFVLIWLKFIYSEKVTKFCKILTLLLFYVVPVKSKVKISPNFVAFSEYMKFIQICDKNWFIGDIDRAII